MVLDLWGIDRCIQITDEALSGISKSLEKLGSLKRLSLDLLRKIIKYNNVLYLSKAVSVLLMQGLSLQRKLKASEFTAKSPLWSHIVSKTKDSSL